MISYYRPSDVLSGELQTPSELDSLSSLTLSNDILQSVVTTKRAEQAHVLRRHAADAVVEDAMEIDDPAKEHILVVPGGFNQHLNDTSEQNEDLRFLEIA